MNDIVRARAGRRALLVGALALLALSGCVQQHLPTLRTQDITVTGLDQQGLTLHLRLTATNERYGGTIRVDTLRVHVTVADMDLGVVDLPGTWDLPPHEPVLMEADVTVPVSNLPALAMAGASGPVPYHLEGNAHVQNIGWSVDFSYDGHIPQEQLIGAGASAIPILMP